MCVGGWVRACVYLGVCVCICVWVYLGKCVSVCVCVYLGVCMCVCVLGLWVEGVKKQWLNRVFIVKALTGRCVLFQASSEWFPWLLAHSPCNLDSVMSNNSATSSSLALAQKAVKQLRLEASVRRIKVCTHNSTLPKTGSNLSCVCDHHLWIAS